MQTGLSHPMVLIAWLMGMACVWSTGAAADDHPTAVEDNTIPIERFLQKPSPTAVLQTLKAGNERFVAGQATHAHLDAARLSEAGRENQADHALATVLSCSDSRVPVEAIFDQGVMDLFVVRVAGNICDSDEIGTIEYGLAHVNTPVLVILGHQQCGAVTAVSQAATGQTLHLERNIPGLVDNILPAVQSVLAQDPELPFNELVDQSIQANVVQAMVDLFTHSPAARQLVNQGNVQVVGAIYDVATGNVAWLPENTWEQAMATAMTNPNLATNVFFEPGQQAASNNAPTQTANHGGNKNHDPANLEALKLPPLDITPVPLVEQSQFAENKQAVAEILEAPIPDKHIPHVANHTVGVLIWILGGAMVLGVFLMGHFKAFDNLKLLPKLTISHGALVLLLLAFWGMSRWFYSHVNDAKEEQTQAALIQSQAMRLGQLENAYLLEGLVHPETGQKLLEAHSQSQQDMAETLDHLDRLSTTEAMKNITKDMRAKAEHYNLANENLVARIDEIASNKKQLDADTKKANQAIAAIIKHHKEVADTLDPFNNPVQHARQHQLLVSVEALQIAWLTAIAHHSDFLLDQDALHLPPMEQALGVAGAQLQRAEMLTKKTDEAPSQLAKDLALIDTVKQAKNHLIELVRANIEDELIVMREKAMAKRDLAAMVAASDALQRHTAEIADANLAQAQQSELATLVSACLIGVMFSVGICRSLVAPIRSMSRMMEEVGHGDLTVRLEVQRKDELGHLEHAFNAFTENFHDSIDRVSVAAQSVAAAATELSASSEQTSRNVADTNHQVMNVFSAIAQMSATVKEVAHKSSDAAGKARDSGQMAYKGGEIVEQTIHAMGTISDAVEASATRVEALGKRGEQIGQVIAVINEIAEQTNLLALNAAIEAARAGEHGRGFAVVADEVRKLADRTTGATEEIGESILAIQRETQEAVDRMQSGREQVGCGVQQAQGAGESLKQIVRSAEDVTNMIAAIAAATEEQSAANESLADNMNAITASTRQTSESTDQVAEAGSDLSHRAEELNQLVQRFKLRNQ